MGAARSSSGQAPGVGGGRGFLPVSPVPWLPLPREPPSLSCCSEDVYQHTWRGVCRSGTKLRTSLDLPPQKKSRPEVPFLCKILYLTSPKWVWVFFPLHNQRGLGVPEQSLENVTDQKNSCGKKGFKCYFWGCPKCHRAASGPTSDNGSRAGASPVRQDQEP